MSKERLRIVEERYHIGNFSRLDYQQAKVDFNADSAQYMKQQELLHTSRIQLNELMANEDVDQPIIIQDSLINVDGGLNFEELWNMTANQRFSVESLSKQHACPVGLQKGLFPRLSLSEDERRLWLYLQQIRYRH